MNRTEGRILQEDRYWRAVGLCLVHFHKYDSDKARNAIKEFQNDLGFSMRDMSLLYHEEPFYLACDISDEDLRLSDYRDKYTHILQEASSL